MIDVQSRKKSSHVPSKQDQLQRRSVLQSLVFYNHFEELQTMLFEVELIINNTPLIHIYRNTIETCLTPNYSLFGKQLV